jgi:hypothetical protein
MRCFSSTGRILSAWLLFALVVTGGQTAEEDDFDDVVPAGWVDPTKLVSAEKGGETAGEHEGTYWQDLRIPIFLLVLSSVLHALLKWAEYSVKHKDANDAGRKRKKAESFRKPKVVKDD